MPASTDECLECGNMSCVRLTGLKQSFVAMSNSVLMKVMTLVNGEPQDRKIDSIPREIQPMSLFIQNLSVIEVPDN